MRVDLLVLHCRIAAADVDGEQLEPALVRPPDQRLLILGDDDDGRRRDHDARVLIGRRAHAARDHQPDMDAVVMPIGVERLVEPPRQRPRGSGPMSIAIALAPSNSRSRWRSRKAIRPLWTRSPSHTPSPSMKPLNRTPTPSPRPAA